MEGEDPISATVLKPRPHTASSLVSLPLYEIPQFHFLPPLLLRPDFLMTLCFSTFAVQIFSSSASDCVNAGPAGPTGDQGSKLRGEKGDPGMPGDVQPDLRVRGESERD